MLLLEREVEPWHSGAEWAHVATRDSNMKYREASALSAAKQQASSAVTTAVALALFPEFGFNLPRTC